MFTKKAEQLLHVIARITCYELLELWRQIDKLMNLCQLKVKQLEALRKCVYEKFKMNFLFFFGVTNFQSIFWPFESKTRTRCLNNRN